MNRIFAYNKAHQCIRILLVLFSLALISGCRKSQDIKTNPDPGQEEVPPVLSMNNIIGVDQFGRSFPTISSQKNDKQVGLFFWLWIGQPYANGIYDASKILALPDGLNLLTDIKSHNESISPNGQAHFWGEPIWGYYNSDDVWVMRKQIEMLTIAGVDFIFFDATNAFIYKNVFTRLLQVIHEYQSKGWSPPKIAFYTHSRSFQTIREIYRELYKPGLYPGTWYKINDKPLIIGYTDPADDLKEAKSRNDTSYIPGILSNEILSFFHFLRPQWPSDPVYPDGFPWVEWIFPQPMHNGVMNVTVASHPSVPMSFSLTKGLVNWGRGWNPETGVNVSEDVDKGTFFQKQWDHALQSNPDLITIGGWNEWIAYKQPYWDEYVLVDAVNKEYSRDIEPMNGGYEDAFYLQMIRNIRRFKGVDTSMHSGSRTSIDLLGGTRLWKDVSFMAVNMHENSFGRASFGASTAVYYQQGAIANFIKDIKVSHDDQHIYFFIRSKDSIADPGGKPNRLNILIGTGEPALKNWESYEYIIGQNFKAGLATIGKLSQGFNTTEIGSASYKQTGNVIIIKCPRAPLGQFKKFYFKVASEVNDPANIMSYYTSGVSLPMGRLSYMYNMGN